jgi:hypothetical protein
MTNDFRKAITDLTTSEVILLLLKIEHDTWTEPFYLVNNLTAITSNGQLYEPYGFNFSAPSSASSGQAVASVTIDDVDRRFTAAMRQIITNAQVTVSLIRASDPNTLELDPWVFELDVVSVQGSNITADLRKETILNNNLTGHVINADTFPGLFL